MKGLKLPGYPKPEQNKKASVKAAEQGRFDTGGSFFRQLVNCFWDLVASLCL
jgi:hypothetical protein